MFTTLLISCFLAHACSHLVFSAVPLLDTHIMGGANASIRNYPYQVSLRFNGRHICGGSIISEHVVLTAAHCVAPNLPALLYSVQYGVTKLNHFWKVIYARTILRHEHYVDHTLDYDVALVFLIFKIRFSNTAKPITLTGQPPQEGSKAVVTGWGRASESGPVSRVLQVVEIEIVRRSECEEQYKNINQVTERMICAGVADGGKDSCQGDSGGPLVIAGSQVGTVSWGVGCGRKGYAGVYSNIAVLQPWISKNAGF